MFVQTNIVNVTTEMSCFFFFIYFYRYEIMMVFDFEECFEEVNLTLLLRKVISHYFQRSERSTIESYLDVIFSYLKIGVD